MKSLGRGEAEQPFGVPPRLIRTPNPSPLAFLTSLSSTLQFGWLPLQWMLSLVKWTHRAPMLRAVGISRSKLALLES